MELVKETIRRVIQIIFGTFIFDCPGLNKIRNVIYRFMFMSYGKKNIVSKKVMFYVPHGAKKAKINIGDLVRISEDVTIDCSSDITISDNVWISEHTHIMNHEHIICGKEWKKSKNIKTTSGLELQEDCWIGAGTLILPQVTQIGKGAVVGAGSVVTKNIDDYEIVAGNPARHIGYRE